MTTKWKLTKHRVFQSVRACSLFVCDFFGPYFDSVCQNGTGMGAQKQSGNQIVETQNETELTNQLHYSWWNRYIRQSTENAHTGRETSVGETARSGTTSTATCGASRGMHALRLVGGIMATRSK